MRIGFLARAATLALSALVASGCISAWIDIHTGKYREQMFEPQTRESIRAKLGEPLQSYASEGERPAACVMPAEAVACDVFKVRGKIANSFDGSSEATANAITLGAGEVIILPITLLNVAAESAGGPYLLVFFYDGAGKRVGHRLLNPDGSEHFSF
jgi:hypothetical protein